MPFLFVKPDFEIALQVTAAPVGLSGTVWFTSVAAG